MEQLYQILMFPRCNSLGMCLPISTCTTIVRLQQYNAFISVAQGISCIRELSMLHTSQPCEITTSTVRLERPLCNSCVQIINSRPVLLSYRDNRCYDYTLLCNKYYLNCNLCPFSEKSVLNVHAHVFQIDPDTKKKWLPSSVSSVRVAYYHDPNRKTYRIIAIEQGKVWNNNNFLYKYLFMLVGTYKQYCNS